MLKRLQIEGFKSLKKVDIRLPRLCVLFGPNAAGKSNFLDALQALSRIGTSRTLSEALSEPIRGYPVESFSFPPGGLPELLGREEADFVLDAELEVEKETYHYRIKTGIQPPSGGLSVKDEYLAQLTKSGEPKGNAHIERIGKEIRIRRRSKAANPRKEAVGLNYAILSDLRLGGKEYPGIEKCRSELNAWKVYYLDPRASMRAAKAPSEVTDIGVLGENIARFLYRLNAEKPQRYKDAKRILKSIIPSVKDLTVDLDERRGTLDILIRQDGSDFSSRIVSEGTLRVLAMCCIVVNPWAGSLIAYEEPENGVHPRRLELIADLLAALALDEGRQVIITTHSPSFCNIMLKMMRRRPDDIAMFNVRMAREGSELARFDPIGPLFEDEDVKNALTSGREDGYFEALMLRGLIDE